MNEKRDAMDELVDFIEKHKKKNFVDRVAEMNSMGGITRSFYVMGKLSGLSIDGYLRVDRSHTVHFNDGEAYVYLWKHKNGTVFYVGSGKNDRYRSKNRNESFLEEINKADAVIYIIADGMNTKDAREIERLVSGVFTCNGQNLCNKDNKVDPNDKEEFLFWIDGLRAKYGERMREIEDAVEHCVVFDMRDIDDYFLQYEFFDEYGRNWFTRGRKEDSES